MEEGNTSAATRTSGVLKRSGTFPHVKCAESCPNAVWQVVKEKRGGSLTQRVFCMLMHSIVDEEVMDCDGVEIPPASLIEQGEE